MNYDSSISQTVNLSRVLDELILDGTSLDAIGQFLKSHERDIGDIFKQSAFVFDLYDFGSHFNLPEGVLFDHISDLCPVDAFFAGNLLGCVLHEIGGRNAEINELRGKFKGEQAMNMRDILRTRGKGCAADVDIVMGRQGLVEYIDEISESQFSVSTFMKSSYLARSAFQASTFLKLSVQSQYTLLCELVSEGMWLSCFSGFTQGKVYADFACTLLKQLLLLNRTEDFNWVESVATSHFKGRTSFPLLVMEGAKSRLPASIQGMLGDGASFGEVVFESNMLMSEFDVLDLFLYVCHARGALLDGMRGNRDLVEFFELPFDWDELGIFGEADGRDGR